MAKNKYRFPIEEAGVKKTIIEVKAENLEEARELAQQYPYIEDYKEVSQDFVTEDVLETFPEEVKVIKKSKVKKVMK